ncbi:MAG: PKD domain-containing protein [Brumimicrobium sp.]|nr:PKD domain-containing protein [Brumimicrobium sp.]
MRNTSLVIFLLAAYFTVSGQSNNCNTATVITLNNGSACVNGTNVNATSDNTFYGNCNPVTTLNEVWYTYVATGAQNNFQIDPGTMQDPQIVIYTVGCNGTAGSILETCDVATGGNILSLNWGLAPGTQVWIGVMSNSNTDGTFELCIDSSDPPPTGGNTCAGAIPICEGTITADISVLNSSGTFPSCFGGAVNQDVWYTFEVLQGGTFEWSATPSGGSSGVELDWALYDVSGGCPGTLISCNYNYDGGNNSPNGQVAGSTTNCPTNGGGGPAGEFCPPDNLAPGTYAIVVDYYSASSANTMDFTVGNGSAVIAPVADFSINPNSVVCGPSVTVNITDNSIGVPDWDFGDGTTFTGNNPPSHTYTTPGTYAITATIGGDCPSIHTEFVELFGPMSAVTNSVNETCIGDCDGEVSVVPSGGSGNYNYSWSPGGQNSPNVSGLCPDTYQVTITDPVCGNSITESATVGTGISCCFMNNFTVNVSACDPATNTYSVSGIVEFTQPPSTGQLIVEDCNGNQQTFNPPFNSPTNYNITGLNANGAPCDLTAYFTADNTCTMNLNYTAPSCPCAFTFLSVNVSACDPADNTFEITGNIEFQSPPNSGQMIVEDCNGNQQVFNAPFTSPQAYALTGINSDGTPNCVLNVYFTDDPGCTISSNPFDYPENCLCGTDVGSFTDLINGNGNSANPHLLCFNDELVITGNNDFVPPMDFNVPGVTYDPGVWLFVYSCPPTVFDPNDINTDPCLLGVASNNDQAWNIVNNAGDNSTLYYVPITMYSMIDGVYAISINNGEWCFDMGPVYEVTFLEDIVTSVTEDCQAGTATVTVSGGEPSFNGSNFTFSNLQPASASLSSTSASNGGTIVISGLVDGDNYSLDITDNNGCPSSISGTFTGTEDASFTYNPSAYCQDETNPLPNVTGVPGGTFSANGGLTVNASTGEVDLSSATGNFTITYTTPDPVCFSSETFDITIYPVPDINPVPDQAECDFFILQPITGTNLSGNEAYYDAPNGGGNQYNPGDNITTSTTLYIYDETGTTPNCSDEESFNIVIHTTPNINPLPDQTECDSYTLPAITGTNLTGNESYFDAPMGAGAEYLPGDVISNAGVNNMYIFDQTATVPNCYDEEQFDIQINITPSFNLSSTDPTQCGLNDGTITLSGLLPNTVYSLTYSANGSLVGPNNVTSNAAGDILINNLAAGTYSNFIVSLNGCSFTDNTVINLVDPNAPSVNAGQDQEVCEGETIILTANNPDGANISWNNGVSDGIVFTPPLGTNTFTVTANLSGCIATDQVIVTVHPNPTVSAGNDVLVCEGESVTLTGSGANSYSWDNGVSNGISFVPGATQTYTVTGTTVFGCTGTDNVLVTVEALPQVSFEADNFDGCIPVTVNFTNTSDIPGSQCLWSFGDGSTAVGCGPVTHIYNSVGCFDVSLQVTSANGCTSLYTEQDYICTSGYPIADFTFSPTDITTINPEVNFTNNSWGANTYQWNFGDGYTSNIEHPSHTYPETEDEYIVQLIAISASGCPDTAYAVINIYEELIFYVPNTFTPDNDDFNEVFKPIFTSGFDPFDYKLLIFNRWGEVIFESNNSEIGWDGTYGAESNRIVKDGTYVWKIEFKTKKSDERKTVVGHVNVLK